MNIRVNGVAPGVIKTPLWTEHPEKMTFLDETKDAWATPEEVAVAMFRCLEEAELGGGKILEVGAKQTRLVEALVCSPGRPPCMCICANSWRCRTIRDRAGQGILLATFISSIGRCTNCCVKTDGAGALARRSCSVQLLLVVVERSSKLDLAKPALDVSAEILVTRLITCTVLFTRGMLVEERTIVS
jgi:hypothetical protein